MCICVRVCVHACVSVTKADPEGGQGVRTPLPEKSQKNIGFLSNTGPNPLKNHKATKPAFNVGPFIVTFASSITSSTKKTKNKTLTNLDSL